MEEDKSVRNTNKEHKSFSDYQQALYDVVDNMIKLNPEKYEKMQKLGEDVMNKSYNVVEGEDIEGIKIKCEEIVKTIKNYELKCEEIDECDIKILMRIYGSEWEKIVYS